MPRFNKTFLSVDNAEERGFIHRDYIAHCLRWTHAMKYLGEHQRYKGAAILDVGCGKEVPMASMLYSSKMSPDLYVGVDAGKVTVPDFMLKQDKMAIEIYDQENFLEFQYVFEPGKPQQFTLITCFEVLEHMSSLDGLRLLDRLAAHMVPNTMLMLSTPVFNGKAAQNHIHEWPFKDLQDALERRFEIKDVFGTFASIRDYEQALRETLMMGPAFDRLRKYYDTNYLATIFAPLFPSMSRNCLWELKRK